MLLLIKRLSATAILLGSVLLIRNWIIAQTQLGKRHTALAQMGVFNRALHAYMADNGGNPPRTMQGLDALYSSPTTLPLPRRWFGPYLTGGVPAYPWGDPYVYESSGPNGGHYLVSSYANSRKDSPEDVISSDDADKQ